MIIPPDCTSDLKSNTEPEICLNIPLPVPTLLAFVKVPEPPVPILRHLLV